MLLDSVDTGPYFLLLLLLAEADEHIRCPRCDRFFASDSYLHWQRQSTSGTHVDVEMSCPNSKTPQLMKRLAVAKKSNKSQHQVSL